MRKLTNWIFQPRLQLLLAFIGFFTAAPALASPEIQVCFTPEYGRTRSCTQDIVNAIDSARHTILVQAYSFTSAAIAKALVEAHRHGVEVKVILDQRANTRITRRRHFWSTWACRCGLTRNTPSPITRSW